jgi:membrane fusion protein (multidrug efflux system)
VVLLILLMGAVCTAGWYGTHWWTVGRFTQSTDDAYVHADQVAVAPRVSGYVGQVLVSDNQEVTAGQPLVRIDDENYRAVSERQDALVRARQADVAAAQASVHQQSAVVAQARARLAGAQVAARFAQSEAERYRKLASSGAETADRLAQMVNSRDSADATVQGETAALDVALRQAETLQAQVGQAQAQASSAQASLHEAGLDVEHTLLTAPIAGRVGDRSVQVGQFVQPGTRLLSVVPVHDVYVVANFKETQIRGMHVGQQATISVDALGEDDIHGVLESFSPGTGAEFALLPPENATGNFTKIVQRVPVRFRIEADDATRARLIPGLSVDVSVDTRQAGDKSAASADGTSEQSPGSGRQ